MKLNDKSWHGQLQVSGVGKPINREGSITEMLIGFTRELAHINPRELATGKSIMIAFQDRPFAEGKANFDHQKRITEVEESLEVETYLAPTKEDTYDSYYDKLVAEGNDPNTAKFVAADWFDMPQNESLLAWLADPKAVKFRKLNVSHKAYEEASPNEYESLKRYVLETYPEFLEGVTFRTA